MEIFDNDISQIERDDNSVVTVGTFDGLHRGHIKLLKRLVVSGFPSTVVTFYPHPQMVVARPGQSVNILTPPSEKVEGFRKIGIERLIVLKFDRDLMNLTADDFLRKIIIERVGMLKMVMGYDHAFGKNREGNKDFVVQQGKDIGFETEIIDPFYCGEKIVSSTLIRKSISQGDVKSAADYLGRSYSFSGWVIKGEARGATLGYPTANMKLNSPQKMLPKNGVYAVYARRDEKRIPALLYIGNRPTYGKGDLTIEAFLLDFAGSLYGEQLGIELLDRLRGDIKFSTEKELIDQMHRDEDYARKNIFVR